MGQREHFQEERNQEFWGSSSRFSAHIYPIPTYTYTVLSNVNHKLGVGKYIGP